MPELDELKPYIFFSEHFGTFGCYLTERMFNVALEQGFRVEPLVINIPSHDTEIEVPKLSISIKDTLVLKEQNKEREKENKPIHKEKAKERFTKPTVEEVKAYCETRQSKVDAEAFVAFYESKGWMIGKNSMKSWHSAIVTWEKGFNNKPQFNGKFGKPQRPDVEISWLDEYTKNL